MSSLPRLLSRSLCSTFYKSNGHQPLIPVSEKACEPLKPIKDPLKSILDDIHKEQNLNQLVEKFIESSEIYGFRCNRRVYEFTVRRLAQAHRFSSIKEILEHQMKYEDISNEDFAIRLIDLYGKSGMLDYAAKVFDDLPDLKCERTVRSFNALLNACINSKECYAADKLFRDLSSKISIIPDSNSYCLIIRAYCKSGWPLHYPLLMVTAMEDNGFKPNFKTFYTILYEFHAQGKVCSHGFLRYNSILEGFVREGKTSDAVKLLEELLTNEARTDVFGFNNMIRAWCKYGDLEEALRVYEKLRKKKCAMDRSTFQIVVPALCENGDFDAALKICNESIIHAQFLDDAGTVQAVVQTVVDGLIKESKVVEAKTLLKLLETSYGISLRFEGK